MRYLLILVLCVPVYGAEIVRYIDTGSDAAGDGTTSATSSGDNTHAYQSLNAWEAAEETDLDTANNTHIVHCNRTNGGGTDQLHTRITGWTTSATDYITIIADDFPSDGIWDNTKYIFDNNAAHTVIDIREDYVRLINLQFLVTVAPNDNWDGIIFTGLGTSVIYINSCIIKGVSAGTGSSRGILLNIADTTLNLYNTEIYGFISGGDTGFRGIQINNTTNTNIYNCTLYNNYSGILQQAGTVTAINCAVFNNTDDFTNTITMTYCASDDDHTGDSATNVQITQSADDWAALVVDAAGGDFHVTDISSELYNTGNGATPKSAFTDDIIGTTRGPADLDWDIGAYELLVVAPGGGQVIYIQTGMVSILFALIFMRRKLTGD